jgi:hypothetical protein
MKEKRFIRQNGLTAIVLFAVTISCFSENRLDASVTGNPAPGEAISSAFEIRYVSGNSKNNGITDWRDNRVEYLRHYADYAKEFFNDPSLAMLTTSDEEVAEALKQFKPQPLPEVRERILLDGWKWHGYKKGQYSLSKKRVSAWHSRTGVQVKSDTLVFNNNVTLNIDLAEQSWRFFAEFRMKPAGKGERTFEIVDDNGKAILTTGVDAKG